MELEAHYWDSLEQRGEALCRLGLLTIKVYISTVSRQLCTLPQHACTQTHCPSTPAHQHPFILAQFQHVTSGRVTSYSVSKTYGLVDGEIKMRMKTAFTPTPGSHSFTSNETTGYAGRREELKSECARSRVDRRVWSQVKALSECCASTRQCERRSNLEASEHPHDIGPSPTAVTPLPPTHKRTANIWRRIKKGLLPLVEYLNLKVCAG